MHCRDGGNSENLRVQGALESGINVGQGKNVGPGKFGQKE